MVGRRRLCPEPFVSLEDRLCEGMTPTTFVILRESALADERRISVLDSSTVNMIGLLRDSSRVRMRQITQNDRKGREAIKKILTEMNNPLIIKL